MNNFQEMITDTTNSIITDPKHELEYIRGKGINLKVCNSCNLNPFELNKFTRAKGGVK